MHGLDTRSLNFALVCALVLTACATGSSQPIGGSSLRTTPVQAAFWVGKDGDPHGQVDGHPCGGVSIREVTTIPPDDDPYVEADVAVEYGRRGRELQRWRLPVDYEILAVAGDRLLIDHHRRHLWVDSAGAIGATNDLPLGNEPVEAGCPPIDALEGDYVRCAAFRDQHSGKTRRIAYEGVCT